MRAADAGWQVEGTLGQGPHGPVLRVRAPDGRTRLAERALGPAQVPALMLRSARLAGLRHPFVLHVEGSATVDGGTALLLEDLRGLSLDALMGGGPAPVAAVVDLGRKLARALHAAWDRAPARRPPFGLVHGALGPDCVWIDANGDLRLHGLGMVPPPSEGAGPTCLPVAPVAPWTAPERLLGGRPSAMSDVYALGALLLGLAARDGAPWASASPDWHDAAAAGAAQLVQEATGDLALAQLLARMIAFDPGARPGAAEVEAALARMHRHHDRKALAGWAAAEILRVLGQRVEDAAEVAALGEAPLPGERATDEVTVDVPPSRKLWEIRREVAPAGGPPWTGRIRTAR